MSKRTALVTGGTGGIGSAICKDFLNSGYRVVANYYPAEEKQAQEWLKNHQSGHEGDLFIVPGDVADFDSCVAMAARVKKEVGFVDTLVNCAGVTRDKTLRKMEPEMWNLVIQIDLTGVYNVTKQFIDDMADNEFGRIINISSVNGQKGQFGQTNYSAAKAGVHGFTMALAQEMSRKNVTVNTISPGYVETEMTVGQMDAEILQKIVGHVPMGRMAKPEEVSYAVLALCDERASYISGTNLGVNGGFFMSF
jgi:acetoacetyl-CoA reductase